MMKPGIILILLAVVVFIVMTITVVFFWGNFMQDDASAETIEAIEPIEQTVVETQSPVMSAQPKEEFVFDEADPDYREAMRQWVITISETARKRNPDFIIIPQNCSPLLTYSGEVDGELCVEFIDAIDGLGKESTNYGSGGYNKKRNADDYDALIESLNLGKQNGLSIISIDYCDKKNKIETARKNNDELGYIGFQAQGFGLTQIQELSYNLNNKDIENLSQAENVMFLLNPQEFGEKEAYIEKLCATNYDMIIIDAYFNEMGFITSSDVDRLKRKASGTSRLVISYLSIGEAEDYRHYWKEEYNDFPPEWMLTENPEWEGNYPVMYWNEEWQEMIALGNNSYLNKIIDSNFDGVFLDIVDGYQTFESR